MALLLMAEYTDVIPRTTCQVSGFPVCWSDSNGTKYSSSEATAPETCRVLFGKLPCYVL